MRAEIRHFEWTDADFAEADGRPIDLPTLLVLHIGAVGERRGADLFQVEISTPQALRAQLQRDPVIAGRHYLFVTDFSRRPVESFLTKLISGFEAPSWDELATKIGRVAHWEFEDYNAT